VQRLRNLSHERGLTLQSEARRDKENKKRAGCLEAGIWTGGDIDLLFVGLARAGRFLIPNFVLYVGRKSGPAS